MKVMFNLVNNMMMLMINNLEVDYMFLLMMTSRSILCHMMKILMMYLNYLKSNLGGLTEITFYKVFF